MSIPKHNFLEMPHAEIQSADTSSWIAVLPLGATEQHGPHLPFETDTIIADGIAKHLSDAIDDDLQVTFLPTEPIGYSIEHSDFEGSKTLSFEDAINKWIAIGEDLAAKGIHKMMILNAHGGNSPLMTIVATELRVRCNMLCVATSWTRFISGGDTVTADEKAFGIHGGDIETSVVLALKPETVSMENAENFHSLQEDLAKTNKHLRAYGPHAYGWKAQDLNQQGVTGDASIATVEKGEALIKTAVTGLVELVREIHTFDMNNLK